MGKTSDFDNDGFLRLINRLYSPLSSLISYADSIVNKEELIITEIIGRTNSAASRLEESLDYYNAKNSVKWRPFRENVAAVKLFSDVSYITLHLKSSSPKYNLLSGIDTFLSDTDRVIAQFGAALYRIFSLLMQSAENAGLEQNNVIDEKMLQTVFYPEGRLESDLKKSGVEDPQQVIVNLATSYLNLASESHLLKKVRNTDTGDYSDVVPALVNEISIRTLETKFHNLQSMYDTYVSNTDIEDLDADLRLMRGHVSIVYHLLEAATKIAHFYERHMMQLNGEKRECCEAPMSTEYLLEILVNYFLNYAEQFLSAGKILCREVIRKYAEKGTLNVRVPVYRGFHVRPSTLVAKIVQHYGSEVYLKMGEERFDASSPMNLFRVNEKINAEKRRNLARNINTLKAVADSECNGNFEKGLREVFHELLEENKIINYSAEFSLPEIESISVETLGEFANRAIASLLAEGKIDLKTDLEVLFEGDKRVLADLEVLAECGYGEDCYGNNIVLPKELAYLRR